MWCMTYDSERRWPEHGWRLKNESPFLKWCIKFENVAEFQRHWKREFQTQPPTRLKITRLCDKFDTHGTVPFVMCTGEDPADRLQPQVLLLRLWFWKGLQRRHGSLLHNVHVWQGLAVQVYDAFWKPLKWKVHIPRLLHAINDDDPDRRMQFCEWFQQTVNEDEEFMTKIVWSGEAQLCGLMGPNCVVWWGPIGVVWWGPIVRSDGA